MKTLWFFFFLVACASQEAPLPHNQLSEQILTARPGPKHVLSNMAWDWGTDKSYIPNLQEYDLNDAELRHSLFAFQFICKIGGKLYKVCEDKPGFCRVSYEGWFIFAKKKEEYISIDEKYEFLVQARTTCFSQLRRQFDEVD